jgi:catecholate siderophore receptor
MTLRLNLISSVLGAFLLVTSFGSPAAAQVQQSLLKGKVFDQMRAAIAGARITAVASGGPAGAVVSDGNGEFSLPLDPGDYVVTVSSDGFADATKMITVGQARTETSDFILQVAGFTDAVSVTAAAGYELGVISTATKTPTPLRDVPQSVSVVTSRLIRDQLMGGIGDVVRYVPGITTHQGENNRDQVVIRGNSSSADFYVNGVRDDVQYYRDLYNVERIEALKGPNGMMFGRGGGGGVINRVTKQASFMRTGETALQAGSFGNRRLSADLNQPLTTTTAVRLNGVFEDSASFRSGVILQRYGIAPAVTIQTSSRTKLVFEYEHFHDVRVADRGITSYRGRPADIDVSTFYGNAADSHVRADIDLASATIEHRAGSFLLRNRTMVGQYDRSYQNYVPGAVTDDKSRVALSAYNNTTGRMNIFNQTDVTRVVTTGRVRHTLLAGAEVGRQLTDNFRNTGYFDNVATTVSVPYATPAIITPVTYRQSATDADNHVRTNLGAAYAQDQAEMSRFVQLIGGVRFDRFDLQYHNNRNADTLRRVDHLVSPRAGLVIKPIVPLSIYGSCALSYLPSSGDQFSSLTTVTQEVKPEQFANYEVGVKWDANPTLSMTTALYRLDRTNTRSTDPNDPTRIVQTGSQRTNGYELGVNGSMTGAWKIAGGYAYQNAAVIRATTAARAGAQVGQVPHHTLSLWNNYQLLPKLGAAIGIVRRSDMFAAIDNTVMLPGYTRADAALYVSLTDRTRLQLNVENMFDATYYANADSNTNISPGSPRAVRVALTAGF